MNTLHFKYALEVAKTHSITLAADNLFMAQPNLSKAIKELEENLGFHIFERTSKGVITTSKGEEFLIYARNVIKQIKMMKQLSHTDSHQIQRFNISVPRCCCITEKIINILNQIDKDKPIDINFCESSSMQTISNVMTESFNIGFIRYGIEYDQYFIDYINEKQLSYNELGHGDYNIIVSEFSQIKDITNIEADKLSIYTEVLYGDESVPFILQCRKSGSKIYVYDQMNMFNILSGTDMTYAWINSDISDVILKKFNLIRLENCALKKEYKDVLIYQKNYKFTEAEQKFINSIYDHD